MIKNHPGRPDGRRLEGRPAGGGTPILTHLPAHSGPAQDPQGPQSSRPIGWMGTPRPRNPHSPACPRLDTRAAISPCPSHILWFLSLLHFFQSWIPQGLGLSTCCSAHRAELIVLGLSMRVEKGGGTHHHQERWAALSAPHPGSTALQCRGPFSAPVINQSALEVPAPVLGTLPPPPCPPTPHPAPSESRQWASMGFFCHLPARTWGQMLAVVRAQRRRPSSCSETRVGPRVPLSHVGQSSLSPEATCPKQ